MIYTTVDGDMLDAICAVRYGNADLAQMVLDANPGLAALGPVYVAGIEITLPALTPQLATPVRLWGQA